MAVLSGQDRALLVVKARTLRVARADKVKAARVVRVKGVRARVAVRVGATAVVVPIK